jgi:hypothetical protein
MDGQQSSHQKPKKLNCIWIISEYPCFDHVAFTHVHTSQSGIVVPVIFNRIAIEWPRRDRPWRWKAEELSDLNIPYRKKDREKGQIYLPDILVWVADQPNSFHPRPVWVALVGVSIGSELSSLHPWRVASGGGGWHHWWPDSDASTTSHTTPP